MNGENAVADKALGEAIQLRKMTTSIYSESRTGEKEGWIYQ
jgi:hypothetical protein